MHLYTYTNKNVRSAIGSVLDKLSLNYIIAMSEVVCKWAIVSPKRFGPSFLPLKLYFCKSMMEFNVAQIVFL